MASPVRTQCPSPPRGLPTAERDEMGDGVLVEEETLSWFDPDKWYPVKIGDVLEARYQVLGKLGFGSVSTVWLYRVSRIYFAFETLRILEPNPLGRDHKYVTVKISETGHRQSLNKGTQGPHACLVREPLSLSLADMSQMDGGELLASFLKPMVYDILIALDFLHSVVHVVHTDLFDGNIMMSIQDQVILDKMVGEEWSSPGPCKIHGEHELYLSADLGLPDPIGVPIVSDFGDAHFGNPPFFSDVMPDLYRAPEIILAIPWDEKIDIWDFGLMSLLDRASGTDMFFNENGTFKHSDKLLDVTLEIKEEVLESEETAKFLAFMRRILQWRPEDRASAKELKNDPWFWSMADD